MSTNGDENKLDRQTDNQKTSKRALRGFVSVSEAAKFLGVSPDTLRNWEASGKLIPARTEGGARRYSPAILVEYKKSLKPLPKTSVGLTSVSKAAEELRVSADTIRNWDKKGIIKAERTEGGLRRFTRSEIKRLQAELNINPSQNISNNSTPPYTQTAELKKDIVLTTDKPILKNIQALSSADFANYPGTAVSENPDVPTSRVLRVKPLTAFLSIFLVAFLGAAAIFATKYIDLNKSLPNYVKTDNSFTSPSSGDLGEVLAESTPSGSLLQINLDTQINGSLSGNEASFSGELRAPNVLYTLTPGANVTITGDPQRPTISSSVSIGDASTTAKGIASFSSTNFSVTDGAVSLATGGVTNSNLSSSSITINTSGTLSGGGAVSLGGSITLTGESSGVTSIAGTANQVIASASTGDVTLSLPQDIDSSAAVEFSSAELSSILLNGSTSGQLTLQTAAATTDYTFTLPSTGGTSGYVLTTDGSGTTSWISASGLVTTWDSIDNPVANQTLAMSTFTSSWNWATGTSTNNLFNITSDASSNGTGSLVNIQTGASSTLLPLRVRAGSTEALTVDANGNVGIGTTGAGAKLQVNGGIISSSTLSSTTVSSLALSYETTYGRIMAVGADVFTNGLLRITSSRSDGSNETILIAGDANGNVGVGTTNPGARFEAGNGTDSLQVSSVGDVTFVDSNDGASITGPAGGALLVTAPTNALNLQSDGSIDVNIAGGAGATGCTVNNTTGALNCAGSITGGSSGVAGYWNRTSTTISPATSGDSVDVGNGGNFTAGLTTGKIGFGGTVSGSDYMTSITGDSTQDWSRLIDITQANDAAEDSAVISITNTANVGTVAGDTIDIKNFYTSLTPTATAQGTTVPAGAVNIYGTDSAISLTSTTLGDSSSRSAEIATYGIKTNITGTPVINNTNADFDRAFYEVYGTNNTISLTPTLTAVTDVGATIYGSYNNIQLNSTGSSGLTSAVYGVFSQVTGDLTTTGNTTHYGGYFILTGSADSNYGINIGGVSGATNNYGLIISGVASASTNYAIYSGAAAQSYIAGNVGIGITNPSRTLHVYRTGTQDSDNPTFQIEQGSTGDPLMQFIITGTQAWNIGVDNSDSDKFKIASAGTTGWGSTRFTIQTDGNVGIGTTAPTSIGSGGSPTVFNLHGTDTTMPTNLVLSTNTTTSGNGVGAIDFGTTGSAGEKRSASIISMLSGTSSSNAVGDLSFYTANGASGLVRKMIIQADGNVGVGDATPDALFDIDSTLTTAPAFEVTQTGSFTGTGSSSVAYISSAATTGDIFTISGASLDSGSGLVVTGRTTLGQIDDFVKITSDIGGASGNNALLALRPDFSSTTGVVGYGILIQATDSTSTANTNYGIYSDLVLTNNAAKGGFAVRGAVSSSSTTADTLYGGYFTSTNTGNTAKTQYGIRGTASSNDTTNGGGVVGGFFDPINTGVATAGVNKTAYGIQSNPSSTGASTGGVGRIQGIRLSPSATNWGPGTSDTPIYEVIGAYVVGVTNQAASNCATGSCQALTYGMRIDNPTTSTNGLSTQYGLYIDSQSGSDTNYQLFSNGTATSYFAGNVGLGTSAPTAPLQIQSNSSAIATVFQGRSGDNLSVLQFSNNAMSGQTLVYGSNVGIGIATSTFNQQFNAGTAYFSGNVGIGSTAPGALLDVAGVLKLTASGTMPTDESNTIRGVPSGDLEFRGGATGYQFINTDNTSTLMVLTNAGKLGLGTTTLTTPKMRIDGGSLFVNSNMYLTTISSAETATTICFSGKTVDGTSTNELRQCSSDARLKENISYFEQDNIDALAIINGLKPAHFDFINGSKNEVGFIAQDIMQVIPETVGVNKSDGYYTFERSSVVPFLVKAVQELNFKVQNALLTLDPQGLASGNLGTDKITIASGIASGGLVTASNFALNASLLNKTGALASIPVSSDGKITVADSLNSLNSNVLGLESRILNQESKEASDSAQIAQASEVAQQAIAQAQSLDEKVASTSANLSSLSAQIQELLNSTVDSTNSSSLPSAPDDGLTPPEELLTASSSATLANLKVTDKVSTINLETLDATISGTFKALGENFLGKTTVAGDLTVDGTLAVTEGNSISAFPVLFLQNNPLAQAINIFNGKVTINKDGAFTAETIIASEYKTISGKISGSGKITAGSGSVDINSTYVRPNSRILITPTTQTALPVSVISKIDGEKFTASIQTPGVTDITFDWFIINEQ